MPHKTTDSRKVVVIGAGQAAGDLVGNLRSHGFNGPITVVGDEMHLPYSRPPLSKAYFSGSSLATDLYIRTQADYQKHSVSVLTGRVAESIDRAGRSVALSGGERIPYDTLVLATGGRPRRLTDPGLESAPNVYYLRTMADVDALRSACRPGNKLVIVGGGYIGLEVAAAGRGLGVEVTVLEASPRVLARVAGPEVSAFYARVHREEGVDVRVATRSRSFILDGSGRVSGVELESGETIPADLLLIGIGLVPNVELAEAAGLAIANGIVVDEFCRTDDPDILAVGDCTVHPDIARGVMRRLESVPNATEQARIAAGTILGTLEPYTAIPWFWSDQYDIKLKVAGLSTGYDDVVIRGDHVNSRSFSAFYLREGQIIAADVVSSPRDFAIAKQLVARGAVVAPALLSDQSVALKEILAKVSAPAAA